MNWTLIVPENPTQYQLARAIENRKEQERPFTPIEIPVMTYPSFRMTPTSLKAFLHEIKNLLQP